MLLCKKAKFSGVKKMLEEGQVLQKRYRIEKQIGQGGMGSVYLATDERFNNTVALKETLFTDDNYLKAFSREARLLNSLKHTALPKVSDYFIDDNGQYIVMEYIAGDDLFEMIEQSGEAFPLDDVKIWGNQLLDALDYLHGQASPIIHRDIKPQNLKLTPEGQVILLDFGLAKGNPTDANHQTAANSIFGYSRNYASLEQIQGTGTDPRSDIYSLAATMYHLLTGKPPADALTRVMMVLNEEKDPLQPAHLIHEEVPEDLSNALQEAMSLNANLRPQSAVEMRELVSGERKAKTVSTRPNTIENKAAGTNLYTQNTKVFPEGESPEVVSKQDDVKTEVLGVGAINSDSIKTKIAKPVTLNDKKEDTKNAGFLTQTGSKRTGLLAAASLGVLLLVGTVVSMVVMLNEEPNELNNETSVGFDSNSAAENIASSTDENLNTNTNLDDLDSENSDLIYADKDTVPDESMNGEDSTTMSSETSPNVSSKIETSIKKNTSEKSTSKPTDFSNKIKTGTSEVIIRNGEIKTKDVTINDKGIVFKTDPKGLKGSTPIIRDEDLKGLTPEQKQEVRNALEKAKIKEKIKERAIRDAERRKERIIRDAERNAEAVKRKLERDRLRRNKRRPPPPAPMRKPKPPHN